MPPIKVKSESPTGEGLSKTNERPSTSTPMSSNKREIEIKLDPELFLGFSSEEDEPDEWMNESKANTEEYFSIRKESRGERKRQKISYKEENSESDSLSSSSDEDEPSPTTSKVKPKSTRSRKAAATSVKRKRKRSKQISEDEEVSSNAEHEASSNKKVKKEPAKRKQKGKMTTNRKRRCKIESVLSQIPEENRKNLTCPHCPLTDKIQVYKREFYLYRHIRHAHMPPEEDKVKVTRPGKIEAVLSQIPEDNRKNLTCPHCPDSRTYANEIKLYHHLKVYHMGMGKPFACDQCDMSFRFESVLKKHVDGVHSGLKHPCPYCPKVYSQALQLTFHMRMHTGDKLQLCPECGKAFPCKSKLDIHMTVHKTMTEDTMVSCKHCGKWFRDKFSLSHHTRRLHSGKDAKYECEVCEKKFIIKGDYLRHVEIHKDNRPSSWKCVICFKLFKVQAYMLAHMKNVHGKETKEAREIYEKFKNVEEPLGGKDFVSKREDNGGE